VSFESRHAKTLADLIVVHGGVPLSAPALKEVPLDKNPEVFRFAEAWFAGGVDVLVLLTGVGTRAMVEVLKTRYDEAAIFDRLRLTTVVPRGPKPIRVLNEWKIPYAVTVPEPNTWRELLEELDRRPEIPLRGKTVAVQEYGVENTELAAGLAARGARVMRVPVYRWALPDDVKPLEAAIGEMLAGTVHAAVFTTAVQAEHLFQLAEKKGRAEELKRAFARIVIASVGPDTSQALRQKGLEPDLEPESPKMGPLVSLAARDAKTVLARKRP
jgi:uroporphyrinogen-III synthase